MLREIADSPCSRRKRCTLSDSQLWILKINLNRLRTYESKLTAPNFLPGNNDVGATRFPLSSYIEEGLYWVRRESISEMSSLLFGAAAGINSTASTVPLCLNPIAQCKSGLAPSHHSPHQQRQCQAQIPNNPPDPS